MKLNPFVVLPTILIIISAFVLWQVERKRRSEIECENNFLQKILDELDPFILCTNNNEILIINNSFIELLTRLKILNNFDIEKKALEKELKDKFNNIKELVMDNENKNEFIKEFYFDDTKENYIIKKIPHSFNKESNDIYIGTYIVQKVKEDNKDIENIVDINYENELLKIKNDFLANLQHEFQTPITNLSMQIQSIKRKLKDTELSEDLSLVLGQNLKVCYKNLLRLRRIYYKMINLTIIDNDSIIIKYEKTNISNLLDEIVNEVRKYVIRRDLEIEYINNIEKDCEIYLDKNKFEISIINILSNAIKFNKNKGKIIVKIDKIGCQIKISIEDTGIGIDKKDYNTIFDKFTFLGDTYTKVGEGAGNGLYIAKHFIEKQKGNIEVTSSLDVGTEFSIWLLDNIASDDIENMDFNTNRITEIDIKERIEIEFSDIYFLNDDELYEMIINHKNDEDFSNIYFLSDEQYKMIINHKNLKEFSNIHFPNDEQYKMMMNYTNAERYNL